MTGDEKMKPIIGVIARPYITDNGRYVLCILESVRKAIQRNGGIPIVILPTQNIVYLNSKESDLSNEDKEMLISQIKLCNGIFMPGGDKIYFSDNFICKYANDNNIPLMGICMGMQVMCNYDNDNRNIKVEGHKKPELQYVHDVKIDKDSKLYSIIQKENIKVNSLHGYKVPNGGSYKVVAKDGDVIEGIEKYNTSFNIGVQWHPERDTDENGEKLLKAFIDACKK